MPNDMGKADTFYNVDSIASLEQEEQFAVAVRMRRAGKIKEAFESSEALSHTTPSLKSYNIYLASAYDLVNKGKLEKDDLKKIFNEALDFYMPYPFEQNIAATLLKCCNFLIDQNMADRQVFDKIYDKGSSEQNENNSYIITQLFKRLITDGEDEKVLDIYERLSIDLQSNPVLRKVLKTSKIINGSLESHSSSKANKKKTCVTIISDSDHLRFMKELLGDFSMILKSIDIKSEDLVSEMNRGTYQSSKAILILPTTSVLEDDYLQSWMFIMGYCIHKFGKNNIILLCESIVPEFDSNCETLSKFVEVNTYENELEIIKILGRCKVISG